MPHVMTNQCPWTVTQGGFHLSITVSYPRPFSKPGLQKKRGKKKKGGGGWGGWGMGGTGKT